MEIKSKDRKNCTSHYTYVMLLKTFTELEIYDIIWYNYNMNEFESVLNFLNTSSEDSLRYDIDRAFKFKIKQGGKK